MDTVRFRGDVQRNEEMELADLAASVRYFSGVSPDWFSHAGCLASGALGLGPMGHLGRHSFWPHYRCRWSTGYHKGHESG